MAERRTPTRVTEELLRSCAASIRYTTRGRGPGRSPASQQQRRQVRMMRHKLRLEPSEVALISVGRVLGDITPKTDTESTPNSLT